MQQQQSTQQGYYRFPSIHAETIVFACEDDLWTISSRGGMARRLTSGLGAASHPAISGDGNWLAFSGRDEGHSEIYVMPLEGGPSRRLTYLGANSFAIGWTPDGRIAFVSDWRQPFMRHTRAFAVAPQGGASDLLPVGPASFVSNGPKKNACVIARPSVEAAFWKRYRGGTAGDLWIDESGDGNFHRLISLQGNPSRPIWLAERIYFISDHEGIGNIYSCQPSGKDLQRHTHHGEYYARNAASDGKRIVYHAGGELFVFDPKTNESGQIAVKFASPRTQRNRKFIEAAKFLEFYDPHPKGHMLAMTVRGKFASMGNWEGAVTQFGEPAAGRFRLATWMSDGNRLAVVSDDEGSESIQIHSTQGPDQKHKAIKLDSRVVDLAVNPKSDQVAITNHRNELVVIDLPNQQARVLDRSEHSPIFGFDYSPDGKWIAYSCAVTLHTSILKIVRLEDGKVFNLTRPVLRDISPVFDPEGKYLYFLSYRQFDPVYDAMIFDLGFPKGMKPYLITLRNDLISPFAQPPKPAEEPKKNEEKKEEAAQEPLKIDLDGIEDRIVAFPVPEGIYQQIAGIKGKALFTSIPVEGSLTRSWIPGSEPPAKATLEMWDFELGRAEPVVKNITNFKISRDGKMLVYRTGTKLRAIKAGEKADEATAAEPPGKKSGWIDLKRLRIDVLPPAEWTQMYGEAWRLQREHFWVEDFAHVDWQAVYDRYHPLLERIATRTEFSDLLTEMQGELGSSHAYVVGGDFREEPKYDIGFLGADLTFDSKIGAWKIARIIPGDSWDEEKGSPLLRPGTNIKQGETLLAVNGRRTDTNTSPMQLLVHQAGVEVSLTIGDSSGKNSRTVFVKTLRQEIPLRYRQWVEQNRDYVHEKTRGRCGYVHIPNMGPVGYAEFHRYFLAEVDREGLLVDVRFNGGGHVSSLLLEKLARRRTAYVQSRWFGVQPYPEDSTAGPMVALTNEYAGSDGDIFSHTFKQLRLGPLLGKRTWGGVIGIWPRHVLIDGGVTTQPEFSFWFTDVGWNVENYGVDPDIEVEYPPQAYVKGIDPQLDRSIEELMKQLEQTGTNGRPKFGPYPDRSLPKLARA